MHIEEQRENREAFMNLLLIADPSEEVIRTYLDRGRLFVLWVGDQPVGVLHLDPLDDHRVEVRNLAVQEEHQGKGYGRRLIAHAIEESRKSGFQTVIVSTGNSSIANLAFYQKCGFRMVTIEPDYFVRRYPEPIYEDGLQCRDRIELAFRLDR